MTTEAYEIEVNGLQVDVVRKPIKNLHVGVYPPGGRVRVAAPTAMSDDAIRLAVVTRLGWIKRQQANFQAQERQSKREMVSGESHYFLGERYRLNVVEDPRAKGIVVRKSLTIDIHVSPEAKTEERERLLYKWYRQQLNEIVPPLLDKWQKTLGVELSEWSIKKMKTKWGNCNVEARKIWLNPELAKKPPECLDYIIVHELMHLLERNHGDEFVKNMDRVLPKWRQYKDELKQAPLGYDEWGR